MKAFIVRRMCRPELKIVFNTLCAGGFPQASAMAFAGALALVSLGLLLYTAGGSVYPTTAAAASEDCYWVIRCFYL